jgi:hypothetical protein
MIKFIKSLFAWEVVERGTFYSYYQNKITGKRKISGGVQGGWALKDKQWIETGIFYEPTPPTGGSGASKQ